jgi:hypothetical protein
MYCLDTEQLPHVTSSVKRFLVNPDGKADGMILSNGVEVCFPAYLSAAVLATVQSGDRVTVYGMLPRAMTMISAAVIETASGERIVDMGPQA